MKRPETTADCISRQAAIEALTGWETDPTDEEIVRTLKELPPEEPERPKGEWIPFEYGNGAWHKCSVCGVADKYRGSMPRPNGTIAEWEYVRNFCPNCGADMRGGTK